MNSSEEGFTHIIPEVKFTCSGTVVRWTVGGKLLKRRLGSNPRLLIWRSLLSSNTTYSVTARIPLLSCNGGTLTRVRSDMYECHLYPGVDIERGDVVGAFLSPDIQNTDQFQLYFENRGHMDSPLNYLFAGERSELSLDSPDAETERALPLISFEVRSFGK